MTFDLDQLVKRKSRYRKIILWYASQIDYASPGGAVNENLLVNYLLASIKPNVSEQMSKCFERVFW